MANPKPQSAGEERADYVLDDYQSVDMDIGSIVKKYINPIDIYRSHVSPASTGTLKQSGLTSSQNVQESRCSAFYRVLGLPVIAPNGKFYSPGFNPLTTKKGPKRPDVFGAIPGDIKQAFSKRETASRTNYSTFAKSNFDASILSMCLSVPNGQRTFGFSDKDKDKIKSLKTVPPQIEEITIRELYITSRFKKRDGSNIDNINTSVYHPLAPFMTDPVIDANLDPKSGTRSVMIGSPFLDHKDLEYEKNQYLKRPGLEFVLRLRLRQQKLLEQTGATLSSISLEAFAADVPKDNQREIAAALSDVGVDQADVDKALKGAGKVELYTLNDLVKTYKFLIHTYVQNVNIIENVSKKIIWIPLCNEGGPEKGTEVSTTFILPKRFLDVWELEKRITQLETKSSIAKQQVSIGKSADCKDLAFSDFTISEFNNVGNTFDDPLKEAKAERDTLEANASNALKVIELVSGEVSGLGLVDIIAVYMSLWSLDINVLLNLIDDDAAERLNDIAELSTAKTEERVKKPGDPLSAYEAFADRVQTILSYADRLYLNELQQPSENDGGDVPRDGTSI